MQRCHLLLAGTTALIDAPRFPRGQALEQPKTTIAVGGTNLPYYLPLEIAKAPLDLGAVCSNDFVNKANAKYPQAG